MMDDIYMRRCIQLARNGIGFVAPNPMVGAVVVYDGKIIGEGYHRRYGEPHAEVNAIASVKDKSLLKESTLYVSLEPCSHYGKTPPCAELIIRNAIPRVVVGCLDPFPEVSGRGVRMLRDAGVDVSVGLLKEACERLNKRFITFFTKKRPYIILKWAQSSDGFIDKERNINSSEKPVRLSGDLTQIIVHRRRSHESAILVGTRTALLDNPSLNVRFWNGKNPLRVVIDKNLTIPAGYHLFDRSAPTLIYTACATENKNNIIYQVIDFEKNVIGQIISDLYDRKVQSLIVEGGAQLLESFIRSGHWDEAYVETAFLRLGSGIQAPVLNGILEDVQKCENSVISFYSNLSIN